MPTVHPVGDGPCDHCDGPHRPGRFRHVSEAGRDSQRLDLFAQNSEESTAPERFGNGTKELSDAADFHLPIKSISRFCITVRTRYCCPFLFTQIVILLADSATEAFADKFASLAGAKPTGMK
jgi:hypothetical protein